MYICGFGVKNSVIIDVLEDSEKNITHFFLLKFNIMSKV